MRRQMFAHTEAASNFGGATYPAASCNTGAASIFAASYTLATVYSPAATYTRAYPIIPAAYSRSSSLTSRPGPTPRPIPPIRLTAPESQQCD